MKAEQLSGASTKKEHDLLLAAVGNNARFLRDMKGKQQKEVAALARIAQSTLSKFEHGKVDINLQEAVRLARVLGCSMQQLLELDHVGRRFTVTVQPAGDERSITHTGLGH